MLDQHIQQKFGAAFGQTHAEQQVGVVLRQSPTAATEAPKGSTITLALGVLGTPTTNTTTTPTTPTTPSGN